MPDAVVIQMRAGNLPHVEWQQHSFSINTHKHMLVACGSWLSPDDARMRTSTYSQGATGLQVLVKAFVAYTLTRRTAPAGARR